MPAVTVWLFALAGLGLSRPPRQRSEDGARSGSGWVVRLGVAVCACVLAVVPLTIAISRSRLDTALGAFDRGDCATAISSAGGSLDALDFRAEPYEVLGYCHARLGEERPAEEAMESAVDHDPDSWRAHYGLALVRALAGRDPRPELSQAQRLNPLERKVQRAVREMRGGDPLQWRLAAQAAGLPL
jgi:hypothetical protein